MKNKIIFIIIVLLVCAGFGFYFYKNLFLKTQESISGGQSNSSSSQTAGNTVNIGGVTVQGEGDMSGVKIEPIAVANNKLAVNIPLPDLNRAIKITANMDENAKKIASAKIQDLSSQLKKTAIIWKTGWSWESIAK